MQFEHRQAIDDLMTSTLPTDFVTRFAPSPTGLLHLGHAYSALYAYRQAQQAGGRFLLRIEDIDQTRCKPEFTDAILRDLQWLGIEWETPVRIQSRHFDTFSTALDRLKTRGLVYPCFCTRKEIQAEINRAGGAPHGIEGPMYPGTCRHISRDQQQARIAAGTPHAWRLDTEKAVHSLGAPLGSWESTDGTRTKATPGIFGDVILARKDTPTSYHLSVVVDDALQGITHIIRGEDLRQATHMHHLLQKLLGLTHPVYTHHDLILDKNGRRFAKRNKAATLYEMQQKGMSSTEVIETLLPDIL